MQDLENLVCEWISTIISGAAAYLDDSSRPLKDMKSQRIDKKVEVCKRELVTVLGNGIYMSEFCRYDQDDILEPLILASVQRESLEFVSAPGSDNIFIRIRRGLTPEMVRWMVKLLRPKIDGLVKIAIDGHDQLTWAENGDGVVGTEPKLGTHWAYKFLVFKVISGKKEYIVDIVQLFDGSMTDPSISALEELKTEYNIEAVVMDGEFHSVNLLKYCETQNINYVVRRPSCAALDKLDLKYDTPYRYSELLPLMENGKDDAPVDYFVCKFRGRKNKKGETTDFYLATNMEISGKKMRKLFRHRWKIETGFREIKRLRIKTTTKDSLMRIFFYAISCMVYNIWIRIRLSLRQKFQLNELKTLFIDNIIGYANAHGLRLKILGLRK